MPSLQLMLIEGLPAYKQLFLSAFSECLRYEVYVNKKERYQFRNFAELWEGGAVLAVA
jgi:hypothetical protein